MGLYRPWWHMGWELNDTKGDSVMWQEAERPSRRQSVTLMHKKVRIMKQV